MDGIICEFRGHCYMVPIRSWTIFLVVLLRSLRGYCGGFISLQMTNCDFLSLPTLLDKLWQIDTKQRNSQIVLFLNWKFSIPAFIHLLPSLQTQPIDLICDILGKSLWVGTAGELTLYNISGNFIFSWLVVSCGCHGICGLRWSSLIFATIYQS